MYTNDVISDYKLSSPKYNVCVFLINIILVKQMVREAGFKDWSFLAKPLKIQAKPENVVGALPASTILIHIRPKKDTKIFWIKQFVSNVI